MVILKHKLADRANDLYETPPQATEALIREVPLPLAIWEPSCGRGAIARVLRHRGHTVYATDLIDYGVAHQDMHGWDFLLERQMPLGAEAIVTNPPFKLACQFVRHALKLSPRVYMLLRLLFLESEGRSDILDGGKLEQVLVFKKRLPMMHRDGWDGPIASSTTAFAWFCWRLDHSGPTVIRRIDW